VELSCAYILGLQLFFETQLPLSLFADMQSLRSSTILQNLIFHIELGWTNGMLNARKNAIAIRSWYSFLIFI
jgi:hypothetical protein